jgi:hypothetical protein
MGLNEGGTQHPGTPKTEGPSGNQQSTRNGVKERKKEKVGQSCWIANNDNGKANRSKQSTIRSNSGNQPDRNGGNLLCDGRQPLSEAAGPPNPPSLIFEVAEVVENRKVSF